MKCSTPVCRRVIVIDDTESIHDDYRKALSGSSDDAFLAEDEAAIFGTPSEPTIKRPDFCVDSAYQGQEGCQLIAKAVKENEPYSVAFVDMRMPPGWDGLQTISKLWEIDPRLQVVICTAYADYSWNQILDKLGVSDQLLILKKPFDGAEVSQLALGLSEKWELTRQAAMKMDDLQKLIDARDRELHHAALHDRLTGLANRYQLEKKLAALLANTAGRSDFSLIFLDFDRFKVINDSLGHKVGDLLLVAIARRLTQALEAAVGEFGVRQHLAARMGGDEFVILLEGLGENQPALSLAEQVAGQLREPYDIQGREIVITASLGVTTSRNAYKKPEDVLRDADAAMYRAKAMGKDRCAMFGQEIHEQMMQRLQLETDLRHAVDHDELYLLYQPVICISSGRILGFEALMRWKHAELGDISPAKFIPVAEETGLIERIGNMALRTAAEQITRWQAMFPRETPLNMNVNISKRQLLAPDCLQTIREIMADYPLPTGSIRLEVTESVIMDRPEHIAPLLEQLRDMGIGIAMDDFGTGQSSLHCLNRFPIDILKIDRAFVRHLERHHSYGAVIQAIITLAKNLDVHVTAEGIETEGQLAQLQALECQSAQGWLFARAQSTEICERQLEDDMQDGWARKLIDDAHDIACQWRNAG